MIFHCALLLLFYFVITFIAIFIAILAGSLGYSKAFKIKNNIINIIEEDGTWSTSTETKVNTMLNRIGYSVTPNNISSCPSIVENGRTITPSHDRTKDFLYCVYKLDENRGTRYRVVTYIYFEIPVISEVLRIPVQGETKTMIDFN